MDFWLTMERKGELLDSLNTKLLWSHREPVKSIFVVKGNISHNNIINYSKL